MVEKHIRLLLFWTLWRIWKARNEVVFNRKTTDLVETLRKAQCDTKEWLDATNGLSPGIIEESSITSRTKQRWKKREHDWVKCNYDVSHHEGKHDSGLGWIIRDSNGRLLTCGMGKFQERYTIEEAELSALIWTIQSVWSHGYRRVEFEGDNSNINNLLNTQGKNYRLQHYMESIRLWRNLFTKIKFSCKPRDQNSCADA